MNDVFPQIFELIQPADSINQSGISTRKIKNGYTSIRQIKGMLTQKSIRSIEKMDDAQVYGTFKQLNIRVDPASLSLSEVKEGDQLKHIDSGRTYEIRAIYPAYLPPELKKLMHIRCEVTDISTIDENLDD